MIVTAIKCDHCGAVAQVSEVPEAWATIGPIITIKGTRQGPSGNSFRERRNKLAALVPKTHLCPDCVERITTGQVSLKLTEGVKA